jgi:hypothetical protein
MCCYQSAFHTRLGTDMQKVRSQSKWSKSIDPALSTSRSKEYQSLKPLDLCQMAAVNWWIRSDQGVRRLQARELAKAKRMPNEWTDNGCQWESRGIQDSTCVHVWTAALDSISDWMDVGPEMISQSSPQYQGYKAGPALGSPSTSREESMSDEDSMPELLIWSDSSSSIDSLLDLEAKLTKQHAGEYFQLSARGEFDGQQCNRIHTGTTAQRRLDRYRVDGLRREP